MTTNYVNETIETGTLMAKLREGRQLSEAEERWLDWLKGTAAAARQIAGPERPRKRGRENRTPNRHDNGKEPQRTGCLFRKEIT